MPHGDAQPRWMRTFAAMAIVLQVVPSVHATAPDGVNVGLNTCGSPPTQTQVFEINPDKEHHFITVKATG